MKRVFGFFVAILFLGMGGVVYAQTGTPILEKVENTLTAPRDRIAVMKMTIIDQNGNVKQRQIKLYQKGKHERLIRFLSPADVKGVSFLSLSDDEMWLYMPAFHKIRRIASHVKNENFMGTDFTYDDMAQSNYTEKYLAEISSETDSVFILKLTPKPGKSVAYKMLIMTVDKKTYLPLEIKFIAKNGKPQKKLINSSIKKIDGYWTPQKMTMLNLLNGHKTVMQLIDVKHNVGLKSSIFTKRFLKRSE